ncbi:MAG: two-component regulator propeller domain-containing protein [Pyrinomonadaceae bacterium]
MERIGAEVQLTLFQTAEGLPSDRIISLYEDREGLLWLGTDNRGLALVRREAVRFLSPEEGLAGSNVYPIVEDAQGGVWVGTWDGGLSHYADGRFVHFDAPKDLSKSLITALRVDSKGRLWVGWYSGVGRVEGSTFVNLTNELDPAKQPVFVIYEDRKGALWFGTRAGLYRYADGEVTRFTNADGLAGNDVKDILEDARGDLWVATYGGLNRLRDGQFTSFTTREGLASDSVRTLHEDAEGTLWIGTYDGGLSRLREGHFTNYTTAEGLYSNGVFRILEDGRGNFWMSCNRGVFRTSREQLEAFAAGKLRRVTSFPYGREDGLLNTECNGGQQPAGIKTRDGRLWFPTQGGVAVIDAEDVATNPHPPPVVIEDAEVDRQSVGLATGLRIEPGQENLEIRYTGLSFINPEHVTFRYRMEGLDADWVEAGTRRVANYAHLPPGAYTFKVIAANSDGVWNTEGVALRVVVVPPFWRTWWFTALVIVAAAALAYAFYRRRVSRLRRAHAAQRAISQQLIELQEGERKRIAAGLHDSLGQNLLVIKNRALLGLQTPDGNGKAARSQLEEISTVTSQTLEEVREIAYGLHPYQMDRLGLTKAIQAMLRKVAAASEIEFTTEIDRIDGLFPKDSEINIYRVVQEGVNNVIKHSRARHALVDIKRDVRGVQIVVWDDGQGFSHEAVASGSSPGQGFGLTGISERTRMLGGTQSVRSTPGKGTTVTINLGLEGGDNGN